VLRIDVIFQKNSLTIPRQQIVWFRRNFVLEVEAKSLETMFIWWHKEIMQIAHNNDEPLLMIIALWNVACVSIVVYISTHSDNWQEQIHRLVILTLFAADATLEIWPDI